MTTTFTGATLADGQLANAEADIYTSVAVTYVRNVAFAHQNAATQTIYVYILRSGGTHRFWKRFVLAQYEQADCIDGGQSLILSAGDKIRAYTTTATAVDYVVTGVTEA
jgi:hypothetical protein